MTATVDQLGAANVNVTIRVGSPGDNGSVTQTISTGGAATVEIGTSGGSAEAPAPTAAAVTQAAPANVDLSVRIASPGTDAAVTQTISASAAAQVQYQPPATQYQPQMPSSTAAAPAVAAPAPAVAAVATPSALPSAWTWNWTWTCGDTTATDIAQPIDIGIQGWIWTWTLGQMCGAASVDAPQLPSINPPQSVAAIVPVVPPSAPSPPDPPAIVAPAFPVPPAEPPPVSIGPFDTPAELTPVGAEPLAPFLPPERVTLAPSLLTAPRAATVPRFARWATGSRPSAVAPVARVHAARPAPRASSQRTRHRTPLASLNLAFPTGGGGASGGGGGGDGGGSGVTAALAVWILLSLPGLAALRLPASRRTPRAPIEEIEARPG